MTTVYLDNEVTGTFTAPSDNQEFTIANKKDFGDKRLDLVGTFSAAGTFDGGTLLLQGYDGAAWNDIAMLTAAGAVRVGPASALNYRALMSGGTAPSVTWWLNSDLWFEGTAPTTPPPTQEPLGTNIWDAEKTDATIVLSNGNLTATLSNAGIHGLMALQSLITGKYYWEITCDHAHALIGVATSNWNLSYLDSGLFSYYSASGNLRPADTAFGDTYGAGDIIGVALDLNTYKLWFSKNGVWQASGDPAAGTNPAFASLPPNLGQYFPAAVITTASAQITANFGASAFTYTAPSGFIPAAP